MGRALGNGLRFGGCRLMPAPVTRMATSWLGRLVPLGRERVRVLTGIGSEEWREIAVAFPGVPLDPGPLAGPAACEAGAPGVPRPRDRPLENKSRRRGARARADRLRHVPHRGDAGSALRPALIRRARGLGHRTVQPRSLRDVENGSHFPIGTTDSISLTPCRPRTRTASPARCPPGA